jgi:hypothetical protein
LPLFKFSEDEAAMKALSMSHIPIELPILWNTTVLLPLATLFSKVEEKFSTVSSLFSKKKQKIFNQWKEEEVEAKLLLANRRPNFTDNEMISHQLLNLHE